MSDQLKDDEPGENPGVIAGDEVFFRHPAGTDRSGRVRSCGRHGATIHCNGVDHQVKWKHVLGHKRRAKQRYDLVEHGEDGHLIKDAVGKHRFIRIPNEAREDPLVAKADKPGVPFTGRPGLTKKQITDRTGRRQTKWVRTDREQPKERKKAAPDADAGADAGYGTHNLQSGDAVSFKAGDFAGKGKIVGRPGRDGAHVKDSSGRVHRVQWDEITGHDKGDAKKPGVKSEVNASQSPVAAAKFVAADYAKSHDDASVTPEAIIAQFPPDTADKIRDVQERLQSIEQTIDQYKQDGAYIEERNQLHAKIADAILSPQRIEAATPAEGVAPTFMILGGRGGSGKSWFGGNVYDPDKAIVLDADHIKGMLPEYEGWNAAQVHEESGELFDRLVADARALGLNVVLDKTMKTAKSAVADVQAFKNAGYRTEAHYMHLPRQEAAKRAVARFLGKTQRYVPVEVVLSNTSNEDAFDHVKQLVDDWSFRDNNVQLGEQPILISSKGGSDSNLKKSEQSPTILLWRARS